MRSSAALSFAAKGSWGCVALAGEAMDVSFLTRRARCVLF
jgi:hypothetical protein